MKKVVSALTAAAMCASMAAGVVSVFAYTADELTYSLKVVSDGSYTVSEDGKTITFASAADAANASFKVGHYIKADASKPAVQQVGGLVEASSPLVHMAADAKDGELLTTPYYDSAKTYDVNGTSFSTDMLVNCFGFIDFMGEYVHSCGNLTWGHSSTWPASWGNEGDNERLLWVWAYAFDQSDYEDYEKTAHFLDSSNSEAFPLVQFDVTLDADIKAGTYTIDFVDTYKNQYGAAAGTFMNSGDSKLMDTVGNTEGLKIVVGGEVEPTTTTTEKKPDATTTTDKQEPSDTPAVIDKYTWDIADGVKPEEANGKRVAYIDVTVHKDEGTNAIAVGMLINGKTFAEMKEENGLELKQTKKGDAYDRMSVWQTHLKTGELAGANQTDDQSTQYGKDGGVVATYVVLVPDTVPDGVYDLTFYNVSIGNGAGDAMQNPALGTGTLVIGDVEDPTDSTTTTADSTAPTTTTTKKDDPTTTTTKKDDPTNNTDYLYGDVNKNGKVELVDIVMLNRNLTGYGDQKLDDYQTEVADCYDDAKLDGKDSMEILKYLLGLNAKLPTAAK